MSAQPTSRPDPAAGGDAPPSPGEPARRRRALRALAIPLLLLAAPAPAAAQRLKVAVLPFNGPQAPRAQAEVVKALRRDYEMVPQKQWDEAASKLFAKSTNSGDVAAVAADLGVAVVITGSIKSDGGFQLVVSVRSGATGKSVDKLRYPLRGPRLDPSTLKRLGEDVGPAVQRAAEAPAAPPAGEPATEPAVPRDVENENPLAPKEEAGKEKDKDRPKEGEIERPDWSPYFDVTVGALLSARQFGFDQAGLPQFRSSGPAGGLEIDANVYPLAFLGTRPSDTLNGITGLGLGLTYDHLFWPESVPCTRDVNGNCMATTEKYGTREFRVEGGLRWHWNLLNRAIRPELLVNIQYGLHSFSIDKKACTPDPMNPQVCSCTPDAAAPGGMKCVADVGPPDVAYSYLTIGVGGRFPFAKFIALIANFNFHIVLGFGEITDTATEFGSAGGYGLRAQLALERRIWKGLVARLGGFYERFGLSFTGAGMPRKNANGGAADQFFGGWLSVGYVF